MRHWLKFVPPSYLTYENRSVITTYEVWLAETNLQVGYVEKYHHGRGSFLWRALDHMWRQCGKSFSTREEAAQSMMENSEAVRDRVALLRPEYTLKWRADGCCAMLNVPSRGGTHGREQAEESRDVRFAVAWRYGEDGKVLVGHPGTYGKTEDEAKEEGRRILADASLDPSIRLALMPLAVVETNEDLENEILEKCEEVEIGDELLFYDVAGVDRWRDQPWWPE